MDRLKVMIVEDHPLMQMGIKKTLERCDDITVIGEASTGKIAAEMANHTKPDVVVMDMKLPDSDGISIMKNLRGRYKDIKVLMFTGFDDERYVLKAFESGANGYLLKNVGGIELADAVRQVAEGMNPVSPQLVRSVLPSSRRTIKATDRLTPREREIWRLLSSGASNVEISKELFVSESTVKFHIRNIFHKLGAKNRVEAAKMAYDSIVA